MLKPTREEFMARYSHDRVVALRRRIPADLETPVSAFLKLQAMPDGQRARFLLESVERGIQVGRYSFIGMSPLSTLRLDHETLTITREGVTPDIELDNDPASVIAGKDPQLERAVQEVLEAIRKNPRKLPSRPADPVKTK